MKELSKEELLKWFKAIEGYINQLPPRYHLEGFKLTREKLIMRQIRKLIEGKPKVPRVSKEFVGKWANIFAVDEVQATWDFLVEMLQEAGVEVQGE